MKNVTKQTATALETKLAGFIQNALHLEQQLQIKGGQGTMIDPSGSN